MNRSDFRKFLKTLKAGVDYQYVQLPGSTSKRPELVFSRATTMRLCAASVSSGSLDLTVAINRTFRLTH